MAFLSMVLAAAAAHAQVPEAQIPDVPTVVQVIEEEDQYVLRTLEGAKPLYTFDNDEPGKSNCVDQCITAWPALTAAADAEPVGDWTVISRPDGSKQWAYKDQPVYTFVRDQDSVATGNGMGGVWHLLPTFPAP